MSPVKIAHFDDLLQDPLGRCEEMKLAFLFSLNASGSAYTQLIIYTVLYTFVGVLPFVIIRD